MHACRHAERHPAAAGGPATQGFQRNGESRRAERAVRPGRVLDPAAGHRAHRGGRLQLAVAGRKGSGRHGGVPLPPHNTSSSRRSAALAYDIANEPHDAGRMYRKLGELEHPGLEHLVLSRANSRSLTEAFGHIGLREREPLAAGLSRAVSNLRKQEYHEKVLVDGLRDDYAVLLSAVSLAGDLLDALDGTDGDRMAEVGATAAKLLGDLEPFSPDPWIEIVAAGRPKTGAQVAYLAPTDSLSERAYGDMRGALGPAYEVAASRGD